MAGEEEQVDAGQAESKATCTFFKKGRAGGRVVRKKKEASSSSEDDESQVVKKERKRTTAVMAGSKGLAKKKRRTQEGEGEGDESDGVDEDDLLVLAKSDRQIHGTDQGATRTWDVDGAKTEAPAVDKSRPAVSSFIKPGPRVGSTNVRVTQRFDYQPDVCKDYKETGYCGFGDTCKFLHDRSDYKTGWQLEREWEHGQYGKRENLEVDTSSDEEDVPFACFICRNEFNNPVVTKCGHYFCLKCALDHYKQDKRCFVCEAQTNGIFNSAKNIADKLKRKEKLRLAAELND